MERVSVRVRDVLIRDNGTGFKDTNYNDFVEHTLTIIFSKLAKSQTYSRRLAKLLKKSFGKVSGDKVKITTNLCHAVITLQSGYGIY